MQIKIRGCEHDGEFVSYSLTDLEKTPLYTGEYLLRMSVPKDMMRKLMGKTLTILDASINDPRQNKAIKDLVRQAYNEELCWLSDMAFDQETLQNTVPGDIAYDKTPLIAVEDVLGVEK